MPRLLSVYAVYDAEYPVISALKMEALGARFCGVTFHQSVITGCTIFL